MINAKESSKFNFFYQCIYQILAIILPLITSPYISRILGADGIGVFSYTYSIVVYFVMVAKLGLHNYGNRCIATVRDDKEKMNQIFSDLFSLHLIICLIVMCIYVIYVFSFGGSYKLFLLIQGIYLIGQLLDINWFFFGIEKFKITVTRNIIIKILTTICVFIFVKRREDLILYFIILAVGSVLSESMVWFVLPKYVQFKRPQIDNFKQHIKPMLVLFIPSIAVSIYKYMDKIMIGVLSDNFQVGYYENSEKIINMCLAFITALGTVMLPKMTHAYSNGDSAGAEKLIRNSSKAILILSYAMMFGIIGVSNVFPSVFWGNDFSSCSTLLVGLAISLPFTAIANVVRSQYLLPKHRDKEFVLAVCMGAVINLIVNAIMIPKFQALGAVIGTIAAEVIVSFIQLWSVRKEVKIFKYIFESLFFLVLGVFMAGITYYIGNIMGVNSITLVVQVCSGAALYCGISFIFLLLKKDDLLKEVFKRK